MKPESENVKMDAEIIIDLLEKRRAKFWDLQSNPDGGDAAQQARYIADEYADLLKEIKSLKSPN